MTKKRGLEILLKTKADYKVYNMTSFSNKNESLHKAKICITGIIKSNYIYINIYQKTYILIKTYQKY